MGRVPEDLLADTLPIVNGGSVSAGKDRLSGVICASRASGGIGSEPKDPDASPSRLA